MHAFALLVPLTLSFSAAAPWAPRDATWADLDGNGRPDLLMVGADGRARLFLAGEDGALAPAPEAWGLAAVDAASALVAGDVDGDGLVDLVAVGADGAARLFANTGSALRDATPGSGLEDVRAAAHASLVDYDRDGRIDLALSGADGALALLRNAGTLRFERVELEPDVEAGIVVVGGERETEARATSSARDAERPGRASRAATTGVSAVASASAPMGSATSAPGRNRALPAVACAPGVSDAAGGGCIPASTTPTAGHLLPLGTDLFVEPSGHVGMGTTSPLADLHVHGGLFATLRASSFNAFTNDYRNTIELGNQAFDSGMAIEVESEGLEIYSRRLSQGGPIDVGPHLSVLRQDATAVGIGTATPATALDVDGEVTTRDDLHFRRNDGVETALLQPERFAGGGARLSLRRGNGVIGARLDGQLTAAGSGALFLYRANGTVSTELVADDLGAAYMRFYKPDNTIGILFDADFNGDARIRTEVLEITGGADLVESFGTGGEAHEPGSVLAIDVEREGELVLAAEPYDPRVAGVVSGAGGVQPGLHLGQRGVLEGETPVALTGRVYVRCNAESGAIRPGDLLTTSSTPGEAMRAADRERAFGAVLGKALGSLEGERGLVLVLVGLQ